MGPAQSQRELSGVRPGCLTQRNPGGVRRVFTEGGWGQGPWGRATKEADRPGGMVSRERTPVENEPGERFGRDRSVETGWRRQAGAAAGPCVACRPRASGLRREARDTNDNGPWTASPRKPRHSCCLRCQRSYLRKRRLFQVYFGSKFKI